MSASDSISARPRLTATTYDGFASGAGPIFVAGVAFVAVVSTHLINFGADDLRIRLLNADSDSSWSHLCVAAILVASTAMAILGVKRGRGSSGLWICVAGILAFLSFSELSSLHTQIDSYSWGKLVYTPILVGLCVSLWRLSAGRPGSATLRLGLAVLVLSFAIHILGPHIVHALGWGSDSWAYQIKVALKGGTELAGWLLVASGLWRLVLSDRAPGTSPNG